MKLLKKIVLAILFTFCLSIVSLNCFAQERQSSDNKINCSCSDCKRDRDPIKQLEKRKEKVQQELKDGTITKDEADKVIKNIDAKISIIKEFNNMTLPQKKEKLLSNFRARIETKVKMGELTKTEGAQIVKDFESSLEKWDGTGHPNFKGKHKPD